MKSRKLLNSYRLTRLKRMARVLIGITICILSINQSVSAGDQIFPLGLSMVPEEMRKELPPPYGISFNYVNVRETMNTSDFVLSVNNKDIPASLVNMKSLDHNTSAFTARADAWILPFLNVYGIAGGMYGTASNVRLGVLNTYDVPTNFSVDYDGYILGGGTTAALGMGPLFASYDVNYTWTTVDKLDSEVETLTQAFRAGVRADVLGGKLSVYGGAFSETIYGTQHGSLETTGISGSPIKIGYTLKARAVSPWNALVGTMIEITPHVPIIFEYGFGQRKQLLTSVGYRF